MFVTFATEILHFPQFTAALSGEGGEGGGGERCI